MSKLDHIFICCAAQAPEAELLITQGFTEGLGNIHPGQGTQNRRFFFANFFLEFLWVANPTEAQSKMIQPTHLWDRWLNQDSCTCPFGFGLRPAHRLPAQAPFSTWDYQPPYLPKSTTICIATNSDILTEPMLFYLPFGQRPDDYPIGKIQPLIHENGLTKMTHLELVSPYISSPSIELQAMIKAHIIQLSLGQEYLIKLGFDGELKGQQIDFRPLLPLIVSY